MKMPKMLLISTISAFVLGGLMSLGLLSDFDEEAIIPFLWCGGVISMGIMMLLHFKWARLVATINSGLAIVCCLLAMAAGEVDDDGIAGCFLLLFPLLTLHLIFAWMPPVNRWFNAPRACTNA